MSWKWYRHHTPFWIKWFYRGAIWKIDTPDPTIYLTFDDGPIPEVTEYVLRQLQEFNAMATFFVVGDNVRKYPDELNKVIEAGHAIGNHTYHHVKGWSTDDISYQNQVEKCGVEIEKHLGYSSRLFRPPHGQLKQSQLKGLRSKYQVIMWERLSGDFDLELNTDEASEALQDCESGDIVVFHDSLKAYDNLKILLPLFLRHYSALGYSFKPLTQPHLNANR